MTNKDLFLKLAEVMSDCTEEVRVCVPDDGYYSQPDDFTTGRINIVNPDKLKDKLIELAWIN